MQAFHAIERYPKQILLTSEMGTTPALVPGVEKLRVESWGKAESGKRKVGRGKVRRLGLCSSIRTLPAPHNLSHGSGTGYAVNLKQGMGWGDYEGRN